MSPSGEPFDPYYHWLGIRSQEQPPDHYRLLGIERYEENREVIQNAADRQMAHLRTYQSGPRSAASQKLLNEVSAARVCLLSPDKKASYDAQLHAVEPSAASHPPEVTSPSSAAPPPVPAAEPSSSTDAAGLPPVVTKPAGPRVGPRRTLPRRPTPGPAILMLVLGCLLFGAVVVLAVWWFSADDAPSTVAEPAGRLVLRWPAAQRRGATLEIDGIAVDLATAALIGPQTIEVQLEPGPHTYRILRPSFQPLEGDFTVAPGGQFEVDVGAAQGLRQAHLVLDWPMASREGAELTIDGRPYALGSYPVRTERNKVHVWLSPGEHRVSISRNGSPLFEKTVMLDASKTVSLAVDGGSPAVLELSWNQSNRENVVITWDGKRLDLSDPDVQLNDSSVRWFVATGRKLLTVRRNGRAVLSRQLSLSPGGRLSVNLDKLLSDTSTPLVLLWPAAERREAQLQVDGRQRDLPAGDSADAEQVVIALQPGRHQVQVNRPGYRQFERQVVITNQEMRLPIKLEPIVGEHISAEEKRRLGERFRRQYQQYQEYRDWREATEPRDKQRALSRLLNKLEAEAERLESASKEQYVAYDQLYQLAVQEGRPTDAYKALRRMHRSGAISDAQYEQRKQELRKYATEEADFATMISFFRAISADRKELTDRQIAELGQRICDSPEALQDYRALERVIEQLEQLELVPPAAADRIRSDLYLKVAENASLDIVPRIELAEKIVAVVPRLIEQGTQESLRTAAAMAAAINGFRRPVLGNPRLPPSWRARFEKALSAAEELEGEINQGRRVAEARAAAAAGQANAAQHKLLGMWLLHQSHYERARTHLRKSGDDSLAELFAPLPDSIPELLQRATALERESQRAKYSERNQAALRAYAQYVRQRARSTEAGTSGTSGPADG